MAETVITYTEFTIPHYYSYGDCMVKDGVQYQCSNTNGVNGIFREVDWNIIPNERIGPELTIVLNSLQSQINNNSKEILQLNNLLARLIFELLEQGIEMESKELNEELETYIKNIT